MGEEFIDFQHQLQALRSYQLSNKLAYIVGVLVDKLSMDIDTTMRLIGDCISQLEQIELDPDEELKVLYFLAEGNFGAAKKVLSQKGANRKRPNSGNMDRFPTGDYEAKTSRVEDRHEEIKPYVQKYENKEYNQPQHLPHHYYGRSLSPALSIPISNLPYKIPQKPFEDYTQPKEQENKSSSFKPAQISGLPAYTPEQKYEFRSNIDSNSRLTPSSFVSTPQDPIETVSAPNAMPGFRSADSSSAYNYPLSSPFQGSYKLPGYTPEQKPEFRSNIDQNSRMTPNSFVSTPQDPTETVSAPHAMPAFRGSDSSSAYNYPLSATFQGSYKLPELNAGNEIAQNKDRPPYVQTESKPLDSIHGVLIRSDYEFNKELSKVQEQKEDRNMVNQSESKNISPNHFEPYNPQRHNALTHTDEYIKPVSTPQPSRQDEYNSYGYQNLPSSVPYNQPNKSFIFPVAQDKQDTYNPIAQLQNKSDSINKTYLSSNQFPSFSQTPQGSLPQDRPYLPSNQPNQPNLPSNQFPSLNQAPQAGLAQYQSYSSKQPNQLTQPNQQPLPIPSFNQTPQGNSPQYQPNQQAIQQALPTPSFNQTPQGNLPQNQPNQPPLQNPSFNQGFQAGLAQYQPYFTNQPNQKTQPNIQPLQNPLFNQSPQGNLPQYQPSPPNQQSLPIPSFNQTPQGGLPQYQPNQQPLQIPSFNQTPQGNLPQNPQYSSNQPPLKISSYNSGLPAVLAQDRPYSSNQFNPPQYSIKISDQTVQKSSNEMRSVSTIDDVYKFICGFCKMNITNSPVFTLSCGHSIHKKCLREYIGFPESTTLSTCPVPHCNIGIDRSLYSTIFEVSSEPSYQGGSHTPGAECESSNKMQQGFR